MTCGWPAGHAGTILSCDDWDYDPLVPRDEQPTLFHGYDGGYDRGHQLPSADRYTDNPSTFYFTNMTPQLGSLNQKIWANFEVQVRAWARACDTLYVVTGCVLEGSRASVTEAMWLQDSILSTGATARPMSLRT